MATRLFRARASLRADSASGDKRSSDFSARRCKRKHIVRERYCVRNPSSQSGRIKMPFTEQKLSPLYAKIIHRHCLCMCVCVAEEDLTWPRYRLRWESVSAVSVFPCKSKVKQKRQVNQRIGRGSQKFGQSE